MALWVASGLAARLWTLEAVWAIPIAGFLAALAAGQWPWAFYTTAEPVAAVPVAEPNQPGKV